MLPELFHLGPITVYSYGVLLAAAYLLGLKLAMVRARARGLDATRMLDLGIYIIISALVGAKLLLLVVEVRAGLDPGFAKPWAECVIGMVRAAGTSWLESRSMPRAQLVEYLTTILWDGFSSLRDAVAEK